MKEEANRNELKYWVGFSLIPGIGTSKFLSLLNHFGTLENAWYASAGELRAAGLDSRTIENIVSRRPTLSLDREMERLERHGVRAVPYTSPDYPPRLREIHDFPPLLYVRGKLTSEDEWAIAVVGTRKVTVYGRQTTEELVSELARHGITIISGLAKGVDGVAHRVALEAGGRTIAVLACGLDMVYPSDHAPLARRIIEQGALVSEYPLGTPPKADNFPRRNRIMSGMSLGVLVVEAGDSSGALITARLALEQNREVFAVPGSIFSPMSRGTNRLIQEGAKLVQDCNDILEELNLTVNVRQLELDKAPPVTDMESKVLSHLSAQPIHIDELCRNLSRPVSEISSTLALLELKGLVRQIGGMNYILARETRESYQVRIS